MLQLRPVAFAYKDDTTATMHYGLVAEEVAAVFPHLVTYAPTGEVRTVKYQELIPMLLNELQRQQLELDELTVIRKELAELQALVGQSREALERVLGGSLWSWRSPCRSRSVLTADRSSSPTRRSRRSFEGST